MKQILLKIDDGVFAELHSMQFARQMSGSAYGVQDEAMAKILDALDKDEPELVLKFKNKKEPDA